MFCFISRHKMMDYSSQSVATVKFRVLWGKIKLHQHYPLIAVFASAP